MTPRDRNRIPYVMLVVAVAFTFGWGRHDTHRALAHSRAESIARADQGKREADARIADVKREADARIAAVKAEERARSISTCEGGNDYRAADLKTWRYIVGLQGPPPDPIEAKKRSDFMHFTETKDAPRDCQALAKGTP